VNTTFIINGGAGRVISAIPALERYHENNPHDDFKVLVSAFADLYDFHPILRDRTSSYEEPGSFNKHVYNNRVVSPEPYHLYEYYHDKISLAKAFDITINRDLAKDPIKPNLFVDHKDELSALDIIHDLKMSTCMDKVVVVQPFGSTCGHNEEGHVADFTGRSLTVEAFNQITDALSKHAIIIYFGSKELWQYTNHMSYCAENGLSLRTYMSLIANSDYFIGCDSVGQHFARSFDKQALVLMGATLESNTSYPNHSGFKFYRKPDTHPTYNPMRFNDADCIEADKYNCDLMNFTEQEVSDIIKIAFKDLNVG
jgi:ADP-heptose:LPS heptosyltransferase